MENQMFYLMNISGIAVIKKDTKEGVKLAESANRIDLISQKIFVNRKFNS